MFLLTKVFLIGLLHLNFHIETLLGKIVVKPSLFAIEKIDSDPLRSIVSRAIKSKSSLSKDLLEIDLLKFKLVMIQKKFQNYHNR